MTAFSAISWNEKKKDVIEKIEKSLRYGGEIMPTIAESWIKEGKIEGKIEVARNLISMDMNNAQIRNATGLSIKQIEEIRKKNSKS